MSRKDRLRFSAMATGPRVDWLVALGVLTFVVGILVLVWPGHTLVALAVLFGLQLVVSGYFRLIAAIALTDASGGTSAASRARLGGRRRPPWHHRRDHPAGVARAVTAGPGRHPRHFPAFLGVLQLMITFGLREGLRP